MASRSLHDAHVLEVGEGDVLTRNNRPMASSVDLAVLADLLRTYLNVAVHLLAGAQRSGDCRLSVLVSVGLCVDKHFVVIIGSTAMLVILLGDSCFGLVDIQIDIRVRKVIDLIVAGSVVMGDDDWLFIGTRYSDGSRASGGLLATEDLLASAEFAITLLCGPNPSFHWYDIWLLELNVQDDFTSLVVNGLARLRTFPNLHIAAESVLEILSSKDASLGVITLGLCDNRASVLAKSLDVCVPLVYLDRGFVDSCAGRLVCASLLVSRNDTGEDVFVQPLR